MIYELPPGMPAPSQRMTTAQTNAYAAEWNAAEERRRAADHDMTARVAARRTGALLMLLSAAVTIISAALGFAAGFAGGRALGWLLDLLT